MQKLNTKRINDLNNRQKRKIDLESENVNLRFVVGLLEAKNKVLEENCALLKEKNLFYQEKLLSIEVRKSDADVESKDEVCEKEAEDSDSNKFFAYRDGIGGAIFGVFIPKMTNFFKTVRAKRDEIKDLLDVQGIECPAEKRQCPGFAMLHKVNLYRVVAILGSVAVLSGVGYLGYRVWKDRYRNPRYLMTSGEEDGDEDSADELFTAPIVPRRSPNNIVKNNSNESFEAPGISTDFRSILANANNK